MLILGTVSLVFVISVATILLKDIQTPESSGNQEEESEDSEPDQDECDTQEIDIEHLFETNSNYESRESALGDSEWRRKQDQDTYDDRRGPGRF